jgi:transcriptional regulator with XRE-family HTH domain
MFHTDILLKHFCALSAMRPATEKLATMMRGAIPRFIGALEEAGGLRGTDIANLTDVSKATVSRWRSGTSKPQPRNELILSDLYYIVSRLQEYYSSAEIRTWLYARHPQLNGERAIDLIHQGKSIEILRVLDRLDADVYL